MTGIQMRRLVLTGVVATLLGAAVIAPAEAAKVYQLKACINVKTGAVRVVTKSVKCKALEKYQDLKTTVPTVNSVLSGPVPPTDNRTGNDGDFYVDKLKKHF